MDKKSLEASGGSASNTDGLGEVDLLDNSPRSLGNKHREAGDSGDVAVMIEKVLQQTQERFTTMSEQIIRRIDEMAKRVDDLEKNISDLMTEAGVNMQDNN
uniref:Heat shock factor-binding protein 1 n=1 Tax=Ditylenchus dipsaci TaxID=166011 RepID=A0A915EE00_9BILA